MVAEKRHSLKTVDNLMTCTLFFKLEMIVLNIDCCKAYNGYKKNHKKLNFASLYSIFYPNTNLFFTMNNDEVYLLVLSVLKAEFVP